MVYREKGEEVHALVEVAGTPERTPRVCPVLYDWLAHLLCYHAFDENTRVEGLIHVRDDNIRTVKEFSKVDQIHHPTIGFGAILGIWEVRVEKRLLPFYVELKAVSLWNHKLVTLFLYVFDQLDVIDALSG